MLHTSAMWSCLAETAGMGVKRLCTLLHNNMLVWKFCSHHISLGFGILHALNVYWGSCILNLITAKEYDSSLQVSHGCLSQNSCCIGQGTTITASYVCCWSFDPECFVSPEFTLEHLQYHACHALYAVITLSDKDLRLLETAVS